MNKMMLQDPLPESREGTIILLLRALWDFPMTTKWLSIPTFHVTA